VQNSFYIFLLQSQLFELIKYFRKVLIEPSLTFHVLKYVGYVMLLDILNSKLILKKLYKITLIHMLIGKVKHTLNVIRD